MSLRTGAPMIPTPSTAVARHAPACTAESLTPALPCLRAEKNLSAARVTAIPPCSTDSRFPLPSQFLDARVVAGPDGLAMASWAPCDPKPESRDASRGAMARPGNARNRMFRAAFRPAVSSCPQLSHTKFARDIRGQSPHRSTSEARRGQVRVMQVDRDLRAAATGGLVFQHPPGLVWRNDQNPAVGVGLLLHQLPRLCASAFRAGRQGKLLSTEPLCA